jgi:serine protease Do
VWEGLRRREKEEKTFAADSLYVYPPPENLGIELDVKVGNKVVSVKAGSAAESAGLRAGDLLERIDKVSIYSQGDVLWALQNAPPSGTLAVQFRRDGKSGSATLDLERGWRKADLSWRPSLRREKGK